jgi:PAS domain S-box-containing protein
MPADIRSTRSFIRTEHAVARTLAETDDPELAMSRALAAIGNTLGWLAGSLWERLPDDSAVLSCSTTWQSDELAVDDFGRQSRATTFGRGEGLPGRVWADGQAAWIADVTKDTNFPRAVAAGEAGLHAAFGFPIAGSDGVVGVIELFDARAREVDQRLIETMASLGAQIGQFVQRRRAEQEVRDASEVRRAMLESALDCVIGMDAAGCVLEFNPAAERTFGYSASEAIGREMAALIVPPSLRDRHRRGLARYIETGEETLLDRRVEITAMRSDGSEFPVELTITRIGLPGAPRFTGYLRDITDRKRAESELRRSRARIAAAAYDERRRIERDIHDGAQQRLVSLALALRLGRDQLDGDPETAAKLIDEAIADLAETTTELRELARGIHPASLTDGGLSAALRTLAARASVPVRLQALPEGRLPPAVESAAYFLVAEVLTNVARYAEATEAVVRAEVSDDALLSIEVTDDGRGGADPDAGSGLRGLADRMAALDGTFEVTSSDAGTVVLAELPCAW